VGVGTKAKQTPSSQEEEDSSTTNLANFNIRLQALPGTKRATTPTGGGAPEVGSGGIHR